MSDKPVFLTPGEMLLKEMQENRLVRRTYRRLVRGRSAHDHETGKNFAPDQSTTPAVRRRMENMPYYLRGEVPPPRES